MNPFATRYIRPGLLPFWFPAGECWEDLQSAWLAAGARGQLVGPHGSGKSALLGLWARKAEELGAAVLRIGLTATARAPSHRELLDWHDVDCRTLVCIDGFEQLSWLRRKRVLLAIRARQARLLATGHGDLGLPWTYHMRPDLQRTQAIAAWLQRDCEVRVHEDHVAIAYYQCQGNVRETLLMLFDIYRDGRPKL